MRGVCFSALCAALAAGEATELNQASFDDALAGNAFIKFMAPWCGHCQQLKPTWDQLADTFEGSRVTIGVVDCTVEQELCGKYEVRGYPSLKVFKRDGSPNGEDYNGGRDFSALQSYVAANLDEGPMCSLANKGECDAESLKVLEESEKMSKDARTKLLTEIEDQIREKKEATENDIDTDEDQLDDLKKEIKKLEEKRRLVKFGGDKLEQLLSDADFQSECANKVCVLAFLPHILDSGAAGRNELLKVVSAVRARSNRERIPVGFMWLQGGDQFEIEEKLNLAFGWPAALAIHLKKERYGVHRGTFDQESLQGFIRSLMTGKVPLHNLPKGLDKFPKNQPWDGKDGELPQEEEL
jgi:protein disulfide-isomerase-like protein